MIDPAEHLGLAKRLAWTYRRAAFHCSRAIEPADIMGAAIVGLMEAASRYRPEDGTFSTFATPRIRGAIIDAVRRDRGRGATAWLVGIDHLFDLHEEERLTSALSVMPEEPEELTRRDLRKLLAGAPLLESERSVIEAFARGVPMGEICRTRGVSESRASQLKAAAIRRIQEWARSY
jgi:RNA polymerase sigma factor (sigma-70 family)